MAAVLSRRMDLWLSLPALSAGGGKTGQCAEGTQGANVEQTLPVSSAASETAWVPPCVILPLWPPGVVSGVPRGQ